MARQYIVEAALLPQGWAKDLRVTVTGDGVIAAIEDATSLPTLGLTEALSATSERVKGIVIPGMPNVHSHAFQRGLAGNTEFRQSAHDSFWTWRRAMYALANSIEPHELKILATQLFIEMLKAGYTSVAEFHYLHRAANGGADDAGYVDGNALWDAIIGAAVDAGIGLTLLPTLYQTSDFGGASLKREQRRFALDTDVFLRAVESRVKAETGGGCGVIRTGAAFHSLRAVPLQTLHEASKALRAIDSRMPVHIHIAEQIAEVEACRRATGRRPIELLLATELLDEFWCLVHATHATAAELDGIASSAAAVCVSISTEANLGDGLFQTAHFVRRGGRICIGSDSQATVCPAEELRWMEYEQRLRKKRRGVLADRIEPHVGTRLWREAARHGAHAIGQTTGAIAVGRRADWLVLDNEHPSMVGAPLANSLDHLIFAQGNGAISNVMVAGRWVVRDRQHAAEIPLRRQFRELMVSLAARR